jgi:hypothetical protein
MPISTIDQKGLTNPLTSVAANTVTSAAATALTLQSAGTTAVTISTAQNVGIGTTSPANKLVVSGTGTISSRTIATDTGGQADFFATNNASSIAGPLVYGTTKTAYGALGSGESAFYSNVACTLMSENTLKFAAGGNTERMRIDTSGRVGIGTSSPSQKLAVNGDTYIDTQLGVAAAPVSASGIKISAGLNSGDGGNPRSCILCNTSQSPGSNPFILFTNLSNNTAGSITHTGTTTVAYNTSSDYRLKQNITPMTGALAKVVQLKPVTYKWKSDGSDGQGFIAHELAEVCPDAVTGEKDAVDADGNPKYQGVDTSFLVATLTAAIQELKAEFDEYKRTHP